MPNRPLWPLALVSLLAAGDYLLWNWSLSASHDILALVAGLTLPPLLVALAWLLVTRVGRALARTLQRPWARSGARARRERRSAAESRAGGAGGAAASEQHAAHAERGARAAGETSSSSKLAA